jgi:hypothetical protein
MLYMAVERFKPGAAPEIYRRFREKGRIVPEGLQYISSWIDYDLTICWQLMRTDDATLFQEWTKNWDDLMDFEIIPVRASAEVVQIMANTPRPA